MATKFILTLLSLIITITLFSQQQPENPGFENWEDVGLLVEEPVEWSSIKTSDNGFLNGLAPYVWDQSTDAHTGSYSVKLYNSSVLGIVAAGTLTNGIVHADMNPDNGYVYTDITNSQHYTTLTQKPDSIAVWAKFFPEPGDIGQVKAVLHTGTAQIPDPAMTNWIALAQIDIPNETATWTRFSAPFNYFNSTTPEYILFVLSSGGTVAIEGSTIYFDDIELIYNDLDLDITVFLEGPYTGSSQMQTLLNPDHIPMAQPYNTAPWNYTGDEMVFPLPNTNIVDWVLVELRDAATAADANGSTMIAQKAGFLLKDGSVVGLDGTNRLSFDVFINQNLFVVIWHRNHLGIMSANPLVKTDGYYAYDFSDAAEKTYGGSTGCKQLETFGPGVWGMIGGDGDANGTVNTVDKTSFWSILTGKSGYLSSDYNMDGQTNNPDKNDTWLQNINRESQVPN